MKAIGFYMLLNKISDWNKNLFALTFRHTLYTDIYLWAVIYSKVMMRTARTNYFSLVRSQNLINNLHGRSGTSNLETTLIMYHLKSSGYF